LVPCFDLVLVASTTVCCAGRSATRYRATREPLPCVPTAFQGSKCVGRELKRRTYQVRARHQVRANPLLERKTRVCSSPGARVQSRAAARPSTPPGIPYIYTYTYIYTCMQIYMYVCIYIYIQIHIYICTHTHTHTHTHINPMGNSSYSDTYTGAHLLA